MTFNKQLLIINSVNFIKMKANVFQTIGVRADNLKNIMFMFSTKGHLFILKYKALKLIIFFFYFLQRNNLKSLDKLIFLMVILT